MDFHGAFNGLLLSLMVLLWGFHCAPMLLYSVFMDFHGLPWAYMVLSRGLHGGLWCFHGAFMSFRVVSMALSWIFSMTLPHIAFVVFHGLSWGFGGGLWTVNGAFMEVYRE